MSYIKFGFTDAIALDKKRNRALIVDHRHKAIIAADLSSGERKFFYNEPGVDPVGIAIDAANNRALSISARWTEICIVLFYSVKRS
jgi:hypothetical protein